MRNLSYHEILPKGEMEQKAQLIKWLWRFTAHFVQGQVVIYKSFWVHEVENQLITEYE